MINKAKILATTMVIVGMLSVFAMPMVSATLPDVILDDETIECGQTVWIRIWFDQAGADGIYAYCNLTDPQGSIYELGLTELNSTGGGNYSYAPSCIGGVWIVNVTYEDFNDGGEFVSQETTFTMQSETSCITTSVNTLLPALFGIFIMMFLLVLLMLMVSKVTDREKKVN